MNRDLSQAFQYIFDGIGVVFLIMWGIFIYDVVIHSPEPFYPTPELFIEMFSDFRFISLITCIAMSIVFSTLKSSAEKQTKKAAVQPSPNQTTQVTGESVFCIECGFKNLSTAKFCKQCGALIN